MIELPPQASTLSSLHLHSFVCLVFHFRHTPRFKATGKPESGSYSTGQLVVGLCSGPLQYYTQDRAKGCLQPPTDEGLATVVCRH